MEHLVQEERIGRITGEPKILDCVPLRSDSNRKIYTGTLAFPLLSRKWIIRKEIKIETINKAKYLKTQPKESGDPIVDDRDH